MLKKSRLLFASIISIILLFYAFNYIPRNVAIISSRTLSRKMVDYVLNFVLFDTVIYLILSLLAYIRNKIFLRNNK